jgi:8-oxo-dGTP pyrophosphatase MutT (NUDIX family)
VITADSPKHAATVILVRPAVHGEFEVLLTRRPSEMAFLGGMYVFPGGTVRKEDYSVTTLRRCRPPSQERAERILGNHRTPEQSLGHRVAGIRELFEEVGVILCVTEAGEPLDAEASRVKERLAVQRQALLQQAISFQALLESEGLLLDTARLAYFSHWVTPEVFSIRFDTRFYLALLPVNQNPLSRSHEVTHSLWITPDTGLDLCQRSQLPMIFPTFASLRTLADFESLESLCGHYGL